MTCRRPGYQPRRPGGTHPAQPPEGAERPDAADDPRLRRASWTGWRDDPHVHAVVIAGAGDRAFCAGGDIRALRDGSIGGDRAFIDRFFSEEYALNLLIATYPKPYVALIDGVCMGGGIGLSVHAPYRVATEHAAFAMPETAIGLFPDIGATFMLPRLPGELGTYLGMTGRGSTAPMRCMPAWPRISPPARGWPISRRRWHATASRRWRLCETLPPFSLAPHRAAIDHCFSRRRRMRHRHAGWRRGGEWADAALKALRAVSPSALHWTLRALRRGRDLTLKQALDAEFALTRITMAHPDFAEGVRAMVVDKDRKPDVAAGEDRGSSIRRRSTLCSAG